MTRPLYACLVHYPIRDKHNRAITTAITNLDIHDIARSARTFGIGGYFVVTPVKAQRWLAERILSHWQHGWGAMYNPNRKDALSVVHVVQDLGTVSDMLEAAHGSPPLWIATSARQYPNTVSFSRLREILAEEAKQPVCILLGTGWGLHPELILESDYILEPIRGIGEYNHLSVRAAAAIIFYTLTVGSVP
ncbi:MAG: RNA methyltransferase [Candidatus Sumerlaeaceae bacterium]|nr:RNA methyltransferase [Candidatus Sumerlaeaceae bacterium]